MSSSTRCPHCGADLAKDARVCLDCGQPLSGREDLSAGQKNPWAFSLAELFIGTTYICLLLAVTLAAPEWGAVLWGVSAFALARTIWFSIVWKRSGRPFTPFAQIGSYAESLVVISLVAAAASVAFVGVCLPLGASVTKCCGPNYSDALAACAWIAGGAAGLGSAGYLLWWLWIWPIVQWWRRGEVPTMRLRLAALGRTAVVLSSTFVGSAGLAIAGGWAWLLSFVQERRDERLARMALFGMLFVGYVAGCVVGILGGRWATRAGRRWFWPILAAAAAAIIGLFVFWELEIPATDIDDFAPAVIGILFVFIIGMVIHRVLGSRAADGDSTGEPK